MKEKILSIASDLREGSLTTNERLYAVPIKLL